MADQDLVKRRWGTALFWSMYGMVMTLLTVSACQDPTTTISTTHERATVLVVDTVQTIHVDTVLVFHVDSIFIWCWETDHNITGHEAAFTCDNGYMGPLK